MHLQRLLGGHRALLEQEDMALYLPGVLREGPYPVAEIAAGQADTASADAAADLMAGELSAARLALLSDQNVLGSPFDPAMVHTGRLYPEGHTRLQRVLDGLGLDNARVFVGLRDPAETMVSAYAQRVMARGYAPFEQVFGDLDPCTLSWCDLALRLRDAPAVSEVICWRYEDYPRIARRILRAMLPPEVAAQMIVQSFEPEAPLSARAEAQMAEAHAGGAAPDAERARAVRDAFPSGPDHDPFRPFDAGLMADSGRYYAEDLEDLAGQQGVVLLSP